MIDDAMPCLGILGTLGLIFGMIVTLRYLRFRETVVLAEKGLIKPDRANGGSGKDALRWGIALTAVGLALLIGLYPLGFWIDPAGQLPLRFGPWLLGGLLPMFFGLGLVLIYVVTREPKPADNNKETSDERTLPPPPPPVV